MIDVSELHRRLVDVIRPRGRMLTAYSGGVDSTLVAAVARQTLGRADAPVAIGDSASLPRRELDAARQLAATLDLLLIEIKPGEQDDPNYQANPDNRCYFCKTHLYASLHTLAAEHGISFIANGVNRDDLGDYRPGIAAAHEAQVVSPLVEAELGKQQVRALADHLGLPNADKPASPCLASRIPYGTPVTPERLTMVERAEDVLQDLGFGGFRVRHHETVARIELPPDQWQHMLEADVLEQVNRRFREIGYTYVTLDLAGFRSGSGNDLLQIAVRR